MSRGSWLAAAASILSLSGCFDDESCFVRAEENPTPVAMVAVAGNDADCPATPEVAGCGANGTVCAYQEPCESGPRTSEYECLNGSLSRTGSMSGTCEHPNDHCPLTKQKCKLHASGTYAWSLTGGTDEPPLCPWDRPAEGSSCMLGYYGGAACGYWCDHTRTAWTVTVCTPSTGIFAAVTNPRQEYKGTWAYDDACRGGC
jgi:hypothetical protein